MKRDGRRVLKRQCAGRQTDNAERWTLQPSGETSKILASQVDVHTYPIILTSVLDYDYIYIYIIIIIITRVREYAYVICIRSYYA